MDYEAGLMTWGGELSRGNGTSPVLALHPFTWQFAPLAMRFPSRLSLR